MAESAENANDALEEAAFLLSLAPEGEGTASNIKPLADLAEIAVESIAHMIRAVEAVHSLPEGLQADVTDALRAIDAVMSEEKKADEALRNAMAAFISSETSPRMLILRMETARALEILHGLFGSRRLCLARPRARGAAGMSARSAAPDLFFIGAGQQETPLTPELAGSKAANLWQMAKLGLKVPPAFVLSTRLCQPINAGDGGAEEQLRQLLAKGIGELERATGRIFGDARVPLLVSVRSGAARSMPGMLDTILNIGMTQETVRGLIRLTGNPRLAWDSYRRFVQAYAEVTGNTGSEAFAARLAAMLRAEGIECEAELDPEALERLTANYLDEAANLLGQPVPSDPRLQLETAAKAVYRSWESERAREYRRLNKLNKLAGTAVTVQAMVFGNGGGRSGAGVAFTRNPATGAKGLYVDFLFDAQGEDVVAGRRVLSHPEYFKERLPEAAACA